MTSDATPDTGTETTDTFVVVGETETTTGETDFKAEAEKFKALARKHEDRAKANANAAKELEQLKAASMSDLEKAVDIARKEGRAETLREVGTERVKDAIRLNVTGRVADVDEFIEGVNLERFLTDDGQPDREKIAEWVDRIVPAPEEPGFPDLGQGARGSDEAMGLGGDPLYQSLKKMTGAR